MLKNTSEQFGSTAKWLHWSIALLMLAAYVIVYSAELLYPHSSPPWKLLVQTHTSVGVTIGCLVLIRIYWRTVNVTPRLEPGSTLEHAAARISHFLLYFFMVTMPITGWMGTDRVRQYFWTFSYPPFKSTAAYDLIVTRWLGLSWHEFDSAVNFYHEEFGGAWCLWILVSIHASAALYHHYIKHDRTLVRMLPASWMHRTNTNSQQN